MQLKTQYLLMLILGGGFHTVAGNTLKPNTSQVKIAKAQSSINTKTNAKTKASALSTDVKFGDQSVGGKYQLPMEALSVVENEKSIDGLIGVRKNFRDRIARSKGMR